MCILKRISTDIPKLERARRVSYKSDLFQRTTSTEKLNAHVRTSSNARDKWIVESFEQVFQRFSRTFHEIRADLASAPESLSPIINPTFRHPRYTLSLSRVTKRRRNFRAADKFSWIHPEETGWLKIRKKKRRNP